MYIIQTTDKPQTTIMKLVGNHKDNIEFENHDTTYTKSFVD